MKVLIVDDNSIDRMVLRYTAEAHGHEVIEAGNGREGLQMVAAHGPGVIISDVLMPGMDGFQFLRHLKQQPDAHSIPFIFYSAVYDERDDAQFAFSLGADAYIVKPKEPSKLWAEVELVIGRAGNGPAAQVEGVDEEAEYLRKYIRIVAAKLEEKVFQLEETLTVRKSAEEALRESEQRFREIFENSKDCLYLLEVAEDGCFRNLEINPAFEHSLGVSRPDLVGKRIEDAVPTAMARAVVDRCRRCVDEGTAVEDEVVIDLPAGRKTYISNLIPIRNGDGRIHRIVGIGHDITERKRRQRQVELLSFALNELRDAVFVTDNDSHILYVNAAACRVLGYSRKELLRMSMLDIDPDMTQERLAANRLHSDMFGTHLMETLLKTASGCVFPVELDVTAFEYDGVRFFFLVARDISERKRAEEELRAQQRKLSDMAVELSLAEERERRRVAGELHDRIGQTILLGKMKFDALAKGLGQLVDEGVIEDIRLLLNEAVSDVRTLTQQLNPPMLAGAGLGPALEWLGRCMEVDYGLRVEFADDKCAKPLSEELRSVVYQAARELLINVAKHADTGSARLIISRDGRKLGLMVEDRGRGFDLLADSAKGAGESGYGLFSIRERITYLGGEVTVESAPGQGTRVTLRVPLKIDEQ